MEVGEKENQVMRPKLLSNIFSAKIQTQTHCDFLGYYLRVLLVEPYKFYF